MDLFSFDIFDTCYVRACGSPVEAFRVLAQRIIEDDKVRIADFIKARISGENAARAKSNKAEITIDDIYNNCNFDGITLESAETIKNAEIDVERSMLVPVRCVKESINKFRVQGGKIAFISDMYISESILEKFLREDGFFREGDDIYVSCDRNATKSQGTLFEIVRKEYKVLDKWYHFGDNHNSDYIRPRQQGIKAESIIHRLSKFEEKIYKRNYPVSEANSSICKAVRLKLPATDIYSTASDLVAPVFVPYVYSMMSEAKQNNISCLYFVARDGKILYEIAKSFQALFPDIELRYVYMSRSSVYFPACDNSRELFNLVAHSSDRNKAIKSLTGLTPESYQNDESFNQALEDAWRIGREGLLGYLLQTGLATKSEPNQAIVDLRGTGKTQKVINNLLINCGYKPIDAFYFELTSGRVKLKNEISRYHACILGDDLSSGLTPIKDAYAILESYFSAADHPRTVSYRRDADGVYTPVFENEGGEDYRRTVYEVNVSACKKWTELYIATLQYKHNDWHLDLGLRLLADVMVYPPKSLLRCLSHISQADTGTSPKSIVRKLTVSEWLNGKLAKGDNGWYRGSFCYTFGRFSLAASAIYRITTYARRVLHV